MSLKIEEIYQVQELLGLMGDHRDQLHDIKSIIPDDQRQIHALHLEVQTFLAKGEPISLSKVENIFAGFSVLFEDYKDFTEVKTYLSTCQEIASYAILMHGTEEDRKVAEEVLLIP